MPKVARTEGQATPMRLLVSPSATKPAYASSSVSRTVRRAGAADVIGSYIGIFLYADVGGRVCHHRGRLSISLGRDCWPQHSGSGLTQSALWPTAVWCFPFFLFEVL